MTNRHLKHKTSISEDGQEEQDEGKEGRCTGSIDEHEMVQSFASPILPWARPVLANFL